MDLSYDLKKGEANLHQDCDVMIDQIRAIDNNWLLNKVGDLPKKLIETVKENLMVIIDLD